MDLGAAANTTTAPVASDAVTTAGGASDSSRVLLSDLRSFLANLAKDENVPSAKKNVDFSASLTSDALTPILADNPDWIAQLEEHLPDIGVTDETKKQQLRDTISSPQFQQALSMFSNALQSGQLGPVVSQFKLNQDAVEAANRGDLEQFVRSLEKSAKEISTKSIENEGKTVSAATEAEKKKDDKDDKMEE